MIHGAWIGCDSQTGGWWFETFAVHTVVMFDVYNGMSGPSCMYHSSYFKKNEENAQNWQTYSISLARHKPNVDF